MHHPVLKRGISSIFVKISTFQGRFWPCEREVSLFFPFSFLAKVNDVLQSEQRKEPKEIYLFLDGDAPLPPSPFILPSATFFTPNYFPRERENAVHFSPLITFFFFFFFSLVVSMEKLGNKFASHQLGIWPFFNSEGRKKILDQRYNLFLYESYDQHQ